MSVLNDYTGEALVLLEEVSAGASLKILITAVCLLYTEYFFGSLLAFEMYFALSFIDCIMGTWWSARNRTFSFPGLWKWPRKVFTHLLIVVVFGIMSHLIFILTGKPVPIVNGIWLWLASTEALSILTHASMLDLPVPNEMRIILISARRKSVKVVMQKFGDEKGESEIESALQKDEGAV